MLLNQSAGYQAEKKRNNVASQLVSKSELDIHPSSLSAPKEGEFRAAKACGRHTERDMYQEDMFFFFLKKKDISSIFILCV